MWVKPSFPDVMEISIKFKVYSLLFSFEFIHCKLLQPVNV